MGRVTELLTIPDTVVHCGVTIAGELCNVKPVASAGQETVTVFPILAMLSRFFMGVVIERAGGKRNFLRVPPFGEKHTQNLCTIPRVVYCTRLGLCRLETALDAFAKMKLQHGRESGTRWNAVRLRPLKCCLL